TPKVRRTSTRPGPGRVGLAGRGGCGGCAGGGVTGGGGVGGCPADPASCPADQVSCPAASGSGAAASVPAAGSGDPLVCGAPLAPGAPSAHGPSTHGPVAVCSGAECAPGAPCAPGTPPGPAEYWADPLCPGCAVENGTDPPEVGGAVVPVWLGFPEPRTAAAITTTSATRASTPIMYGMPNQPSHQKPTRERPIAVNTIAPTRAASNRPRIASCRWMRPSAASGSSAQPSP